MAAVPMIGQMTFREFQEMTKPPIGEAERERAKRAKEYPYIDRPYRSIPK